MNIPEVKKYLGGAVKVRWLRGDIVHRALSYRHNSKYLVMTRKGDWDDIVPYIALINEKVHRIAAIYINPRVITKEHLDDLLSDPTLTGAR